MDACTFFFFSNETVRGHACRELINSSLYVTETFFYGRLDRDVTANASFRFISFFLGGAGIEVAWRDF
jgi:hypothetical protein